MKMNHLFYDSDANFKALTSKRVVLSILIGLASAVLIYSFFYGLRETDRILFFDFEERPIVVPEGDRQLFNLFFAAISVILGNSFAISFLFAKPQKVFSRRNNKHNRILNDQAFLGLNFIHWFAKVWFLFATFSSQFTGSKFINNFLWPSVFLILVLYLDSWKSLSLVIKKSRWKIMSLHFLTILLLVLGLSQLNIIDYKSIDDIAYSARPTVEVPKSTFIDELYLKRYYDDLVFKLDYDLSGNIDLQTEYNTSLELSEVQNNINEWKNDIVEELRYRATPRLRANKNIPIAFIKEFESKVYTSGNFNIIYEVANDNESTKRFYNNQIKYAISPSLLDVLPRKPYEPPRVPYFNGYKERVFLDTIRIDIANNVYVDNMSVELENLATCLKKYIKPTIIFEYVYKDITTFQDYINVLSAHNRAIKELKIDDCMYDYDEMILQIHRNQFSRDEKLKAELDRLRKRFPILITERFE